MTSPLPPRNPGDGKPERGALSPATKIFAASTTLLIGSVAALAFWRPSLDGNENPLMDRLIVSAPLPGESTPGTAVTESTASTSENQATEPNIVASLPSLEATPSLDTGKPKYAQVFPAPILATESAPRTSKARQAAPKASVPEQSFQNVTANFNRIHDKVPVAPKAQRPNSDFSTRPESVSTVEMSDSLLPYFHTTENLRPISGRSEKEEKEPENPFLTAPSSVEAVQDSVPLRPLPSMSDSLTELRPLRKVESKEDMP